ATVTLQFACSDFDARLVQQQLASHLPDAAIVEGRGGLSKAWTAGSGPELIVDLGLSEEFVRPLRTATKLQPDPLSAIIGSVSDLGAGEAAVLQVLFEPAKAPWAAHAMRALLDSEGRSFFVDAPEMAALARQKLETPLFAVVLRAAGRGATGPRTWEITRALV